VLNKYYKNMSSKSKINQPSGMNPKNGVYGMDMRWRASRLGNIAKNRGTKMIKKMKKTNW